MGDMQKRAVRLTLVALLVAVAVAAAAVVANAERRIQALDEHRRALEMMVERLEPSISGIAVAQQAYIDYGHRDEASFTQVASLLDRIAADAAPLRTRERFPQGAAHLEAFWRAHSALAAAAADASERLALQDSLAAADVLLSAARPHTGALAARLRAFRDAEFTRIRSETAALARQSRVVLGGVTLLWLAGLLALVRVPAHDAQPEPPQRNAATAKPTPQPAPASRVDLAAAAELCTAVSRLTHTGPIPELLQRAASVLEARGIIIWMGAGDELFAAAAYGYDPAVIARLRPIRRSADNATAAAWRTGELRTVARDSSSLGAIVAPMFGATTCIGVLAAEVRNGREADADTRAVTAIIASQLASVLSAWPAASAASDIPSPTSQGANSIAARPTDAPPGTGRGRDAALPRRSHRQPAAS